MSVDFAVCYGDAMQKPAATFGRRLCEWRRRRRVSQLRLACDAGISTRHLSFLETGRSLPSREMILHLARWLEIPMREQNLLLVAAGFAPLFPETSLDDPSLEAARQAVDFMLARQKPYPAFAIDRYWNIAASNAVLPEIYTGVAADLLRPPVNALRLSLHPSGLAPRIANLPEWRSRLLSRLQRQIEIAADPALVSLMKEISAYPCPAGDAARESSPDHDFAIPLRLLTPLGLLSFFSTTMVFGAPLDVTLSDLALEFFFPTDAATAKAVEGAQMPLLPAV